MYGRRAATVVFAAKSWNRALGHSFCHVATPACYDCIEDNKNQLTELTATNSTDKPEFKCKICGEEYEPKDCIDNWFQLEYWSKNKAPGDGPVCQSCEGEKRAAVIKCEACDWICFDCEDSHKRIKILKSHVLDESTRITPSQQFNDNTCHTHNEKLTVFCKTCNSPYCARCILKDHYLHVYQDTKDETHLNDFYNNLKGLVDKMKKKRGLVKLIIQNFETFEPQLIQQKKGCNEEVKQIAKICKKK